LKRAADARLHAPAGDSQARRPRRRRIRHGGRSEKKLVHSFEPSFIEDGPSRVTYEIEPMGMVCKLTVTHDDFPPSGPTFCTVREGWPEILSSLKSLLETGRPLVIPRDR
jgi:hypothetical protein